MLVVCLFRDLTKCLKLCARLEQVQPKRQNRKEKSRRVYMHPCWVYLLYIDLRPGQTCHYKDGGSAYFIGMGELGRRVKIPRYSHRLTHRKRVTCELHDSYFRLMTIKHAIPKTAEVTHSDGQWWGDIEWAIELLYNSVKTGSQLVLETRPVGDKMQ